jgi:hypothetical protein
VSAGTCITDEGVDLASLESSCTDARCHLQSSSKSNVIAPDVKNDRKIKKKVSSLHYMEVSCQLHVPAALSRQAMDMTVSLGKALKLL